MLEVTLGRMLNNSRLQADDDKLIRDQQGILDLNEGFTYVIIDRAKENMDDGFLVPCHPDGMACFQDSDGNYVLMRNHEMDFEENCNYFGQLPKPQNIYDKALFGGVTKVVVDPQSLKRKSSRLVLTGTARNCAGGISPMGWFTCEEPSPDMMKPNANGIEKKHGYVFLVPHAATAVIEAKPITSYGRFRHEAVAFDPATGIAYLTEDDPNGCFYRFVPQDPGNLFEGKLQALKVKGKPGARLRNRPDTLINAGDQFQCEWVDIDMPDAETGNDVHKEAQSKGAAWFDRGEGAWFFNNAVYFACTSGGAHEKGQIFRYAHDANGGVLELLAESNDASVLNMPDNITIAPGGHIIYAEDNYDVARDHIGHISPDGVIHVLARNAKDDGEFTGVCLSPDGRVLFANIFETGITVAITGPFSWLMQ